MRTALVFPGQGSQRAGMGAPWRESAQWELVEEASELAGRDLEELLLHADADALRATGEAQIATHLVSLLVLAALPPDLEIVAVAGHSLGEYAALVAAGALARGEAVRLVLARGAAMQAAADRSPGTMAAVLGAPHEVVAAACAEVGGAWVANLNGHEHIVISGTPAGVAAASARAMELGARRVLPLPVGGAFHSPLMEPALPALRVALAAAAYRPVRVPVVCNVDAAAHTDGWAALLEAQLLAPVRWQQTLDTLAALGVEVLLECGAGGVLTGLARRGAPGLTAVAVATPADLAGLARLAH